VSECNCGENELTRYAQWVAYSGEVHTPVRCGYFTELRILNPELNDDPAINVQWPTPKEMRA
jgi:hypothetical protein